ncbi:acetyl-CoA carboxylase, carboxyltransferase subunit beta [Riemerella anatipestifer]|uniref:Acetyl-coenzyme A carboxylase carboxyl transferase subunit beta n=1 Tax=Riemerella anatipestifer RA-CH-1 TaxID=1228997 RepID=J9R6Z3_RIEAN|nr:acetyl-CoA carboxylase, carboxyltransferase subunit beta [Riemerella anatipestifer]AFR35557.1 Acetyl-CoA carboxylase beta subunit [Riemerella anatipestifer RA-CH-1]AIH02591.1 acetyl-CoA carboxylase, carboxyl transferase, beta subunit [Riemerella anatipestifer CH3]MCO7331876.1 acetyl-CoA carboxylase, carboxyltransferase subunit beta [Riemerella anatipestifer]MCO7350763.1 acetyl-CoA carboxylase, carboxyltransferase subunit beta [Riemerella anatipestifer]MCU7583308.1 acetyl-CoA carboxylase, ca
MAFDWFRRKAKNITTSTEEKKDIPKGLWHKTPTGKIIEYDELKANQFVSPEDGFHVRIGSKEYYDILFNEGKFKELDAKVESVDILKFKDTKPYTDRLKEAKAKTKLNDSIRNAVGKVNATEMVVSCMDFAFIGGSLGSVMGEKITRAIDYAIKNKLPYVLICQSGGARMQEAAHSLMQMAKVQAKLVHLSEAGLPYIAYLTDPTFGGITASFAMTADVIMAEPGALIGFAGPRVIRETIGRDLPEGFQTSEFLKEKGFVDFIVNRKEAKVLISKTVNLLMNK